MIVVDSSPRLAILFKEPEKQSFEAILAESDRCVISAVNAHETACVLRLRHNQAMVEELWRLLAENDIEIVPFDEIQVRAAAVALDRYGKGIDPKARLNLCDCAAYALAKTMDSPLLFKGNDFTATDARRYLASGFWAFPRAEARARSGREERPKPPRYSMRAQPFARAITSYSAAS